MQSIKIIIGSSNQGKIKEIKEIFKDFEILEGMDSFKDLKIEENGSTFEENALLKAQGFYESLKNPLDNLVVLADDSGLCVEALGGEPGIYSARYANMANNIFENASDEQNLKCLLEALGKKGVSSSSAIFVAAIALVGRVDGKKIQKVLVGKLEGKVISEIRGKGGFGYDPLFVPKGYENTLSELGAEVKNKISHRKNALENARAFLNDFRHF